MPEKIEKNDLKKEVTFMSNTQHTGKKSLLAALLAAVIVSAAVLAGCGGSGDESSDATADQVVKGTSIVTYTETVPQNDSGSAAKSSQGTTAAKQSSQKQQATTKANSKQQSQASAANNNNQASKSNNNQQNSKSGGSNNGGNNNGGSSKSSGNNGSSGNRTAAPSAASNAPVDKKTQPNKSASDLTIGNKHFKVGDTVTCTYYLKVPEKMLNFQGSAYFDPSLLELTDAYLIEPANNGGMLNNNLKDHISFNGSNLSGYDFVDECYPFITVEYKVTGTGVTQPGIKFEVITDINDKTYTADNGTVNNGAELKEEYK